MEWYYAVGTERKGPVSDDDLRRLAQEGVVTASTLVWREGMAQWQPYAGDAPPPLAGAHPAGDTATCTGCGRAFPRVEVIPLANGLFCAACKPVALQRMREGVGTAGTAEETRKEYLKHEASVKSIGVLYYLGAIIIVLLGVANAIAGVAQSEPVPVLVGLVLLALGVGQFWVGTGLRRLKKWARIPTGILSGIGLLGIPIGTIINAYILYLVFSRKGAMVFSEEYQEVIRQTPHIKYRTSIIVWIFLGLILAVIGLGLVALIFGARR